MTDLASSTRDGAASTRVLLVEDDPDEVRLLRSTLVRARGVRLDLHVVETLQEAVAEATARPFDVVLLDLSLPDSSGVDTVVGFIRASDAVPVVVLTGSVDDRLAAAAIEAGAQDYLVKGSVTPEVLGRVVRHARERHRLRTVLELRERRFRAIAEAAQDAIYRFRCHPRFELEYLNPAVERLSGFSPEEFHATPNLYLDRLHPDDRCRLRTRDLPADGDNHTVLVRFQRADGTWISLEDSRSAVLEDGVVVGVQGVVRDVTAHQRATQALQAALRSEQEAAEQLRATNDLKSQFLQAVSHELRTPLTSIIGFAQTLVRSGGLLAGDQVDHFHERILANAERLQSLMTDLLDLEQLTGEGQRARRLQTDVTALATRTAQDLVIGERRCTVEPGPCLARVDPTMVERILRNLLNNVIKHTPPTTAVRVQCVRADGVVRITVSDDGPGVPVELREQAFEPFWQGPAMQSAPSPGTGVGLAVVRRFASLHDGAAWLEPTPGGGTTVVVELAEGEDPDRPDRHGQPDPVAHTGPRQEVGWRHLTADDRELLQPTLQTLLRTPDAVAATDTVVAHLQRLGACVVDAPGGSAGATVHLEPAPAVHVAWPDGPTSRTLVHHLSLLLAYARYVLATRQQGAEPRPVPTTQRPQPATAVGGPPPPTEAAAVTLWATRELFRAETVEELVGVLLRVVDALGGTTLPARLEDARALPLDVSLGTGEPLLPVAEPASVARMHLERHLPGLVADARHAADRMLAPGAPAARSTHGLATRHEFQRLLSRLAADDAVVALDLDGVTTRTREQGDAGEAVLPRFVACLLAELRVGDRAARVGHDEFALLLRGTGRAGAEEALDRLRRRWAEERDHPVTFEAGIAVAGEHSGDVVGNVDRMLFAARRAGRRSWDQGATPAPEGRVVAR